MAQGSGSLDILKENQDKSRNWGGARAGSGRPPVAMTPAGKERAAVKKAFEDRVAHNADELFNAQFNLAKGEQYLMHKYEVGHGSKRRTEVEVVTNPETIKSYLDGTLDEEKDSDEFYYLSTKPANGMAIDSLLDRAFGKAPQKMAIEHSGEIGDGKYDPNKQVQFEEWLNQQTLESKTT